MTNQEARALLLRGGLLYTLSGTVLLEEPISPVRPRFWRYANRCVQVCADDNRWQWQDTSRTLDSVLDWKCEIKVPMLMLPESHLLEVLGIAEPLEASPTLWDIVKEDSF